MSRTGTLFSQQLCGKEIDHALSPAGTLYNKDAFCAKQPRYGFLLAITKRSARVF
jgi:hypothetical protein